MKYLILVIIVSSETTLTIGTLGPISMSAPGRSRTDTGDPFRGSASSLQPFFVGEVFGARGVIQPARAAGSNADVIDARLYLGIIERQLRRVDAGGLVELACQHRLIVHQHRDRKST